jgi:DNA repair protein RadC
MDIRFAIHDVPVTERPRERFQNRGALAVSSNELLAISITTGYRNRSVIMVAEDLLSRFKSLAGIESAALEEISAVPGIGMAKAIRIKAAIELGKRYALERNIATAPSILNSDEAFSLALYFLKGKMQEHLLLFCLNVRGMLIGEPETICIGILDASCIHPREIFKRAIQKSAAGILLAHNHPSGNAEPSDADIQSTKNLCQAGQIIGIGLVDHIVVADATHVSIRERYPDLFSENLGT